MQLKKKIEKSSIALGKLNAAWRPAKWDEDKEILIQEERRSLRQIGLKMDRSLVLGEQTSALFSCLPFLGQTMKTVAELRLKT